MPTLNFINRTWMSTTERAAKLAVAWQTRVWRHQGGQDLIEYTLMAAAIAVAVAAIFPQSIAPNICAIFSKVNSSLGASAGN
jgi:Flp pilus assembly pilin Flp